MACSRLQLNAEIFGPPMLSPVGGKAPVRGQWVGLVRQDGIKLSTDVTGVTVRVQESMGQNSFTITAAVGGTDKSVKLPWTGGVVGLEGGRFPGADFLVIRYAAGAVGAVRQWTYAVFDLRVQPPGSSAPDPIVLGPFDLPAAVVEFNFCPNQSGRLVLLWYGYPGAATGRVADVYRTDMSATRPAQPLVSVDSPAAAGVIACAVDTLPAPGVLSIYDHAIPQPLAVSLPNPPPPPLVTQSAPPPGRLGLSARTLHFAPTEGSVPFEVWNQGQDLLEITSVATSNNAITATPNAHLPVCLKPQERLSVSVVRQTSVAATSTITVNAVPAPAAGANTVAVSLDLLVADPRASVTPTALTWKAGETDTRPIVVKNTGNVPLAVAFFPSPPAGSPFGLTAAQTPLAPGAAVSALVAPPRTCAGAGQVSGSVNVKVVLSPVVPMAPAIAGFPITVQLTACVPLKVKVPPGSLRISTIMADAPGNDILPEGEFIEFVNQTSRALDLSGCRIWDKLYTDKGAPGMFRKFFEFGTTEFGSDSELPAGQTVRVLTRAKQASDANRPWVLYAGYRWPVWNNRGDTGRIVDENNVTIAEYTYVTTAPPPGTALPPGTVLSLPRARTPPLVRRIFVNPQIDWNDVFMVEDGDLVTISASGSAHFESLGLGGGAGPDGEPGSVADADGAWPLEGAPKYALIGSFEVGTPFFVGSMATITVDRNGGPVMLRLGVNDGELWDNNGEFDCLVSLYQS